MNSKVSARELRCPFGTYDSALESHYIACYGKIKICFLFLKIFELVEVEKVAPEGLF